MLFNPPPNLGKMHKISLCLPPAQPLGLLPAKNNPQSDPESIFSQSSRHFYSETIVHLTQLSPKLPPLHLISVLLLLLTSAHLGSGSGLGIYRLNQAQPEAREPGQASITCPYYSFSSLPPHLHITTSTDFVSINYLYSDSPHFPFQNWGNFKTPPFLGNFCPKPNHNFSLEKFPTLCPSVRRSLGVTHPR